MGKSVYYVRKKSDNRCINPDHYQFYYIDSYCKCTNEDYECDLNFKRSEEGNCVPRSEGEVDISPPAECSNNYIVRMGYKKSADNSCVGGLVHEDKELPCPGSSSGFVTAVFGFIWTVRFFLISKKQLVYYGALISIGGYAILFVYDKVKNRGGDSDAGQFGGWSSDNYSKEGYMSSTGPTKYESMATGTKKEMNHMMDDDEEEDDDGEEI